MCVMPVEILDLLELVIGGVSVMACEWRELSSDPLVEQQELLTTKPPPKPFDGEQCYVLFFSPPLFLSKKYLAGP